MSILLSLLLSGCCRNEIAPILDTPQLRSVDENTTWTAPLEDIVIDRERPPISRMESILTNEKVSRNAKLFKGEVEKQGSFRKQDGTKGERVSGVKK